MKRILVFTLTIGLVTASNGFAAAASPATLKQTLKQVPAAEMPAKAAELVKSAKPRERSSVAVEAVAVGLELNPAQAPTLVAAIAKASPDSAATAAGAAAQQQPKSAPEIARAAAAAAPSKAGKIAEAVCRAVPNDYRNIAVAVAQAVPSAGKEILRAVASAIPGLKAGIDSALVSYGKNLPSVAAVLDSPTLAANGSASSGTTGSNTPRGPTIAPPYVPYSGTTSGLRPSDSGPVPRGDRNYASP